MAGRRKDSRGYALYKGEYERKDGSYCYQYKASDGSRPCIYANTLAELREKEDKIKENAVSEEKIEGNAPVYLKIEYAFNTGKTRADKANFFYSLDGENWKSIGETFSLGFDTATTFMGTRSWLVNYATKEAGGYVDFDYYKVK